MPKRLVRDGILSSARVNALTAGAELFYRRLFSVADDYGRYYASPPTLRGACWPTAPHKVTESEISNWLTECAAGPRPLVLIYEIDGALYLQITDFNQQVRSKSKFPEPASNLLAKCSQSARKMFALVGGEDVVEGEGEDGATPASEVLPQPTPEPSKVTQMRPVTLLERDTGWDQIREVWDDGATVIPGEGDWSQALVHWRRLSFEEKKMAVDDRVEMARMLKAGEFHVSSGGLPQSYFQHKHFGRRVKASAAQTRSRPKSKQDQIADAFAAVERNIHAGYRTEP